MSFTSVDFSADTECTTISYSWRCFGRFDYDGRGVSHDTDENKQYVVDASLINMIIFANNFYINRFKKQKRNLTDIEIFNSD